MEDMSGGGSVERIPIVVTQSDMERILRVPKLPNKTGIATGTAVYDTLVHYNLDKVV